MMTADEAAKVGDRLLEVMLETRELIYEMAEERGISRAELNARAGVEPAEVDAQ